jgi:hypothetical protein
MGWADQQADLAPADANAFRAARADKLMHGS